MEGGTWSVRNICDIIHANLAGMCATDQVFTHMLCSSKTSLIVVSHDNTVATVWTPALLRYQTLVTRPPVQWQCYHISFISNIRCAQ